jgi:hypothetical protein
VLKVLQDLKVTKELKVQFKEHKVHKVRQDLKEGQVPKVV